MMGIEFDTGENYIDSVNIFDAANRPFSVAFWFNVNGIAEDLFIGTAQAADNNDFYLLVTASSAKIQIQINSSTAGTDVVGPTINTYDAETWSHFAFSDTSSVLHTIWLNGDVDNKGESTVDITPGTQDAFGIGILPRLSPALSLDGSMAYLTVWHGYSLTDDDVMSLAAGKNPLLIAPDKIAHYFPMNGDGPTSVQIRDMVGDSNLGDTITGTPTKTDSIKLRNRRPL